MNPAPCTDDIGWPAAFAIGCFCFAIAWVVVTWINR